MTLAHHGRFGVRYNLFLLEAAYHLDLLMRNRAALTKKG